MATDPVAEAADALYALVPEEFTAARNERAAGARAGGDAATATRIAALRRPSPSAWLVNRLAREEPERLGDLVGLGGELADAQSAGDGKALGALVAERREIITDLMRITAEAADAAERTPSRAVLDEVEQTLVAASVSADAGAAVASGRLVRALRAVGIEVDLAGAVGGGEPGPPRRLGRRPADRARRRADEAAPGVVEDAPGAERASSRDAAGDEAAGSGAADGDATRRARERAEAAVRAAHQEAAADECALAEASARLDAAERHRDGLKDERDALERRLAEIRDGMRPAERDVRAATRARAVAEADARRSAKARDAADEELRHLDG